MNTFVYSLLATLIVVSASAEDQTKIIQKVSNDGAENSSVLVETTKNAKIRNDFEVLAGEEEISGDPTAGTKEAYASWKEACREWKKELKENNKDGQVLIASCGTAKFTKDESAGAGSGIYTYRSEGKYKVKTRLKDR
jgi:hypothetical protein